MTFSDWTVVDQDVNALCADAGLFALVVDARILVTGASGMIPSFLIDTLLAADAHFGLGLKVVALARNEGRGAQRFARYRGDPRFSLLVQDVCVPIRSDQRYDLIVHAASQASPKYYGVDPVGTIQANSVGTDLLLQRAVRDASRAFIMLSSAEIYGNAGQAGPMRETDMGQAVDTMNVRSCYAESKRVAETMCVAYAHQFGVPVWIFRPFHTYGPGLQLDDGRVFADLVRDVVLRRSIRLTSDGSAVRAYCYVADLVSGILHALARGTPNTAYNVGNDDAQLSVRELAELLLRLVGRPADDLQVGASAGNGYLASTVSKIVPDTSRLRALGWRPAVPPEVGFKRMIQFYEQNR